jgi:hypothetical protein
MKFGWNRSGGFGEEDFLTLKHVQPHVKPMEKFRNLPKIQKLLNQHNLNKLDRHPPKVPAYEI